MWPEVSKTANKVLISIAMAVAILIGASLLLLQEDVHLSSLSGLIRQLDGRWLWQGEILSLGFMALRGARFRIVERKKCFPTLLRLYLQRIFVPVFLPADFPSNPLSCSREISKQGGLLEGETLTASGIIDLLIHKAIAITKEKTKRTGMIKQPAAAIHFFKFWKKTWLRNAKNVRPPPFLKYSLVHTVTIEMHTV